MNTRKMLAFALALCLMVCCLPAVTLRASAAEESVQEIYSGSTPLTGWQTVTEIFTTNWGGSLDPNFITEDGYLSIYFTGTDAWSVHFAMNGATWAQIDREIGNCTTLSDGSYVATISYDDLVAAYGSSDFSTLGAVYIYSSSADTGSITVTSVTYTSAGGAEEPAEPELPVVTPEGDYQMIYSGSTPLTGWQMVAEIYTTTWGGSLDPNFITEDGYLSIYFTGTDAWSVHFAMNGAAWVQIDREIGSCSLEDGAYVATISYADLVAAYGSSDFSTLGAVYIYSNSGSNGSVTVLCVTYTAAETVEPEVPETQPPEPTEPPVLPEEPSEDSGVTDGPDQPVGGTDHKHQYEKFVEAPTCEDWGCEYYYCIVEGCDEAYTKYLPATGHKYEVTGGYEANCTEPGYTVYTCAVCGDSYESERVLGDHEITVSSAGFDATCTEAGMNAYWYCGCCQTVWADEALTKVSSLKELEIAPLGHSYGEDGVCARCGEKDPEYAEPTEPVVPTEPDEPTVPTEPVVPTEPAAPTEPTEPDAPVEPAEKILELYTGSTAMTGWSLVKEIYTTVWGGSLDPNFITEDGYLSIYFAGTDIWSVHFAMNGATWAQIDREIGSCTLLEDGTYVVNIPYADLIAAYGADLSTLGAVYVYTNCADTGSVTMTLVTYTAAVEETPVEPTEPSEPAETTKPVETTEPTETQPSGDQGPSDTGDATVLCVIFVMMVMACASALVLKKKYL